MQVLPGSDHFTQLAQIIGFISRKCGHGRLFVKRFCNAPCSSIIAFREFKAVIILSEYRLNLDIKVFKDDLNNQSVLFHSLVRIFFRQNVSDICKQCRLTIILTVIIFILIGGHNIKHIQIGYAFYCGMSAY